MADQFDYRLLARGVDPIKLDNPLDNALAAAKVQGAQSQNALVGAQAQQAQRTIGIQNELDNFDGTDPSKLSRPAQKQFALDQAATHKAQIEDHLKKFEVIGQIMSGVQDQATYDRARQQAVQVLGADAVKNMNPVYDANEIEQNRIQSIPYKTQLENQLKMLEMQSKDADRQEMMSYRRDMLDINRTKSDSSQNKPVYDSNLRAFVNPDGTLTHIKDGGQIVAPKPTKSSGGQLPASALKLQNESVDALRNASNISADAAGIIKQIDDQELNFGLVADIGSKARGAFNSRTDQDVAREQAKSTIQKIVNQSLMLAKGVQTEGDAQREAATIVDNLNDTKTVRAALSRLVDINERSKTLHKYNIENIRSNFGADPLDLSSIENVNSALGATESPVSSAIASDSATTQSAGKVIGLSGVKATAAKNGWTLDEAIHQAVANGYTINGQ
jgi:hypothetical protein